MVTVVETFPAFNVGASSNVFTRQSGATSSPLITGYRYKYSGGGRTFIRRHKPQSAFIAPTGYETGMKDCHNGPVKGSVVNHENADPIVSINGSLNIFSGFVFNEQDSSVGWPSFSSNLYNGVVTDLRLKVKDQRVNLAQAFLERKRTADLLADSLTRIAKSIQAVRRGKWQAASKMLKQSWKSAPRSWLEFQYGWKPLMQDVYGSVESLQKLDDPVNWMLTVKAGRQEKWTRSRQMTTADNRIEYRAQVESEVFRGIFARVDYAPNDTFLQNLRASSGIGNPLQLAWELLPYSFIIDWGVQVGDWISAMDATKYMEFLGGSYTDRRELNTKLRLIDAQYGSRAIVTWDPSSGPITGRRFSLVRGAWSSWPIATAPRFKNPFSLLHVANALSLLAVAMKPGPVRFR